MLWTADVLVKNCIFYFDKVLHNSCALAAMQYVFFFRMTSANSNQIMPQQNPLNTVFHQYISCPQHRGIIISLSAIVQFITLLCRHYLITVSRRHSEEKKRIAWLPMHMNYEELCQNKIKVITDIMIKPELQQFFF
jgi:hypothetical protein